MGGKGAWKARVYMVGQGYYKTRHYAIGAMLIVEAEEGARVYGAKGLWGQGYMVDKDFSFSRL